MEKGKLFVIKSHVFLHNKNINNFGWKSYLIRSYIKLYKIIPYIVIYTLYWHIHKHTV